MTSSAPLPEVAYVVPSRVVIPLILSMLLYSRTFRGAFIGLAPQLYQLIVNVGFDVQNPLAGLVGTDNFDANRIFNGILTILAVCAVIIGTLMCFFYNLPDLVPLYLWIRPNSRVFGDTGQQQQQGLLVSTGEDDDEIVQAGTGLTVKFDGITYHNVPLPGPQMLIVLFHFLFTVVFTAVFFEQMIIYGVLVRWAVWLITLGLITLGYLITWLLSSFAYTSLWIFGPTERNMRDRDDKPGQTEDERKPYYRKTFLRVFRVYFTLFAIHILGYLVIGGIVGWMDTPNADACWITAAIGLALLFLLSFAIFIYYRASQATASQNGDKLTMNTQKKFGKKRCLYAAK